MQPEREHGSSTPQRTLPSAAHTFVASCQSFGAKLDSDLILVHVSASQHAKAIFLPACSIFLGSVTHWKSFGSW